MPGHFTKLNGQIIDHMYVQEVSKTNMKLSEKAKLKVINLKYDGLSFTQICDKLHREDGITISRRGLIGFFSKYKKTGKLSKQRESYPAKVTGRHIALIDDAITCNPELTAKEICDLLYDSTGLLLSVSRVKVIRKKLGWTLNKTRYCQLIRWVLQDLITLNF